MPNQIAMIDYQKCNPARCDGGICAGVIECPNKVLRQEAPYEFPFSYPSRFCRGCAKCAQVCPLQAICMV